MIDYIRIYEFYKIDFHEDNGKDSLGDCPFCEDEGHFSVNHSSGLYRCFKCEAGGNVNSFFTELHKTHLRNTRPEHYKTLFRERGISSKTFADAEFAFDPVWDRWLVPFQDSKFLSNLGVFYPNSKNPFRILKSPELPIKLYRPFDKSKLKEDVWVFEGEWDLLAARNALKVAGVKILPSFVSSLGATTWTPEMNKAMSGLNGVFFWDNDKAGKEDGPKSIRKRASGFTYSFISWGEEYTDAGIKDVRDLWTTRKTRSKDKDGASLELMDLANNATFEESSESPNGSFNTNIEEIEEVEEYDTFLSTLKNKIYLNDSMRRSFEIVLASCLSVNLPDKPLWVFLIGPASIGKSLLIESFGGSSDFFEYTSKLTAEVLVSGWKPKEGDEDISLLPKLDGKTLFIGDLTVILNLPINVQEKMWGVLREAYGGTLKINFGNQKPKEYHGYKFCMIAGVTHAIYAFNDSDMGERFIKVDYAGADFDEDAHMDAAIRNQTEWPTIKKEISENVLGYYKHLNNSIDFSSPPEISQKTEDKIKSLAKLTTKLRTKVNKDRFEGMISRPISESPTRFATQLITLAKCLMWVRQEKEITSDIYETLKKVAFDSCPGLGLEVVQFLQKQKEATISSIVSRTGIPKTRVVQITTDFKALKILEFESVNNGTGRRGRNAQKFILSESIKAALSDISPSRFKNRPKKKVSRPLKSPKRRKSRV